MISATLLTLPNILDRSIRATLLGESVVEDERTRVGIVVTALRITGTVAIGWNTHCITIEGGTGPQVMEVIRKLVFDCVVRLKVCLSSFRFFHSFFCEGILTPCGFWH